MCGVHHARVPKCASARCRGAGLCSRCSPFILIWGHQFSTLYWSEASPSRPRLSPPWDHSSGKRSSSARKLSPGSHRAGIRAGPPQSPLFWAEWSSCTPFRDLILTPDQTQTAASAHLRLCSSEQRHYFLGSSGLEDRMNQMCAKLLGPSEEENILGLHSLLESVVPQS